MGDIHLGPSPSPPGARCPRMEGIRAPIAGKAAPVPPCPTEGLPAPTPTGRCGDDQGTELLNPDEHSRAYCNPCE